MTSEFGLAWFAGLLETAVAAQLEAAELEWTVEWAVGAEAVTARSKPPAIVVVPLGGSFGPAKRPGRNPRILHEWVAGAILHIWCGSLADVETLAHLVMRALPHVAAGRAQPISLTFSTQNPAQPGLTTAGHVGLLEVQIQFDVSDQTRPTATPDTLAVSGSISVPA